MFAVLGRSNLQLSHISTVFSFVSQSLDFLIFLLNFLLSLIIFLLHFDVGEAGEGIHSC